MIWQPEFTDKTLSRKTGAVQAALTEGSALATYLDWINLLSKRHPASLKRHVRTMIKVVQRLHRRDDTELQRGQQGLSLAA